MTLDASRDPASPANAILADTHATGSRRLGLALVGVLCGAVAALAMLLLMLAGRSWLGVSPPFEALPDRFAPTLDISTFFSLFGRFGGYNGLKRFGILSGLGGLLALGVLFGLLYSLVVESAASRRMTWRNGISPRGAAFIAGAAVVLWIGTVVILWPVLGANYRGLPPGAAQAASMLFLAAAYALFAAVLVLGYRWLTSRSTAISNDAPAPLGAPVGRRVVLAGAAGLILAAASGALLRALNARAAFSYDGLAYSGPGVQPIAPADKFYTVTKNVVDPDVLSSVWRLEIGGMVEEPRTYDFAALQALPGIEQESTLMCISNQIGAGLMSNAVWTGVRLRDLLEASRPLPGAVEVFLRAADGYTDTFSIDKALEPETLVAYAINGAPLPQRHGFPARVVVPGLFGEKNVKWVTRIDVIDYDARGFYEQQGWGPSFVIPTRSDIFAPRWVRKRGDAFVEPFAVGKQATIRGRAFAGNRGIQRVEYSLDDGETWHESRIDYAGTDLTWTFWSFDWTPDAPGEFTIVSRAVDGTGEPQIAERRSIVPQGATGLHRVVATVA
ncbi:MAG: molybdopterin-dependent oxidoreductase [Chloroflexia bacterium]|nr:molybdopterin-dependent oxidoreductase [Chloroflexia bacterium]